jgi:hypothetical protein
MNDKKVPFEEFRESVVKTHVQAIMTAYIGTRVDVEELNEEVARIFGLFISSADDIDTKVMLDLIKDGTPSVMDCTFKFYGKELNELSKSWDSLRNKIAQHVVEYDRNISGLS